MFAAQVPSRVKICHKMYMRYIDIYTHIDPVFTIWLKQGIRLDRKCWPMSYIAQSDPTTALAPIC